MCMPSILVGLVLQQQTTLEKLIIKEFSILDKWF